MIRILNEKDKPVVEEYLERNHIDTTFLIGNVKYFGLENKKDLRRCGDYYGYFENGILKGIIPFYNLGSCIPHFESKNAIPHFIDLMKNNEFKFLLGMKKFIEPLYNELKSLKQSGNISDSYYFVNNNFKEFIIPEVEIKSFHEIDLDCITDFIVETNIKGFGNMKYTKDEAIKSLNQRSKDEDYLFLIKDNLIVAGANIQTSTDRISQIGAVYTLPEHRGRGYCKAVVSNLCSRIISKGKIPTLIVRKNNMPAVKAYKALGFEFYDEYLLIEF
ncbi:GNAT family N-acetyltransferase [Caloramator sp. E03]|uniref:GNAT family N-acetyltransferase n=1 Tax=Caloramator sp. E03 TaxID=2576307 RepID=UPI00111071D3|nr:GNAT family N-acetyltransferase [Caloramator sp. E03]QCX34405.1 GNAT family N-acetyltransferase [Caloramator sp. E03]